MSDVIATAHHAIWIYALMSALGLILAAMWAGHTPESRRLSDELEATLTDLGKLGSLAAQILDAKETTAAPRLSRALRMGEPLNLWRLACLGEDFWVPFCTRILRRYGATVFSPQQTELLRGAARAGSKNMARMDLRQQA